MKIDTTFMRMRSSDHLGDAEMSKKAPRSVEFNFSTNCDRHKRFPQPTTTKEGKMYKKFKKIIERFTNNLRVKLPQNFYFLLQDLFMVFQSLVRILPNFSDLERP